MFVVVVVVVEVVEPVVAGPQRGCRRN